MNQGDCAEKTKLAYTDKLTKEIANQLRAKFDYFSAFDKIIVYYDYGQVELAKILVSVFNTMFSNVEFRKIETNQYKLSQAAGMLSENMWKDGKPKKWYYSIPIILMWLLIIGLIIKVLWL